MNVRLTLTLTAFLVAVFSGAHVAADTSAKLKAAIADESRGSADMARDANRKPLQTLEFFGLKDDMKVLELVPGGGWYTKILAPVLAESGNLQVAIGTDRVKGMIQAGELSSVDVASVSMSKMAREDGGRRFVIEDLAIDTSDVDMLASGLPGQMSKVLRDNRRQIEHLSTLLETLGPSATLKRGYAIVTDESGKVLRSAQHVEHGKKIKVALNDGHLRARVEEVEGSQ